MGPYSRATVGVSGAYKTNLSEDNGFGSLESKVQVSPGGGDLDMCKSKKKRKGKGAKTKDFNLSDELDGGGDPYNLEPDAYPTDTTIPEQ